MSEHKIFITGGTGKIGSILTRRLAEEGYDIVLLTRKITGEDLPAGVNTVRGDIRDASSYSEALKGAHTVLHMAAVTHTSPPERYFEVNAAGTRDLIEACEKNGVKRFIHVSTRAISPDGGSYSVSKIEAEKYVRESTLKWVILRPSEVYGLGGKEGVELLLGKIDKMPFIPVLGTGEYGIAPLHVSDLVEAIVRVVKRDDLEKKIYTLAGPESFTYNELVDRIMEIKNVRKLKLPVPLFFVNILAGLLGLLPGDGRLVPDQVPRLTSEKSSDISLAAEDLSFKPKSIREAIGNLNQ
jgi:nucleoside-diphosphate-sugar epimerase